MSLSINANLSAAIIEINRLQTRVEALERFKRTGRNVTGARAVPADEDDRQQGDLVGDFLYDSGSEYYELQIINVAGDIKWVKYAVSISFTNP